MQENFEIIPQAKNASQFPDVVRARAPRGFADAVKQAAAAQHVSVSAFMREALSKEIHRGAKSQANAEDRSRGFVCLE